MDFIIVDNSHKRQRFLRRFEDFMNFSSVVNLVSVTWIAMSAKAKTFDVRDIDKDIRYIIVCFLTRSDYI